MRGFRDSLRQVAVFNKSLMNIVKVHLGRVFCGPFYVPAVTEEKSGPDLALGPRG